MQRSPGSVGETRCLRWQCLVRIPSERGQTKASTRNCERKPTTRRATGARRSEVGAQGGPGRSDAYKGPVVELEPDPGSIFIIWARAGALATPLEPSKIGPPPTENRPRRFAAQLVTSRAEARRVCCSRGWVVCCSDGSGDHDDRSWVAFAYGRAVWMGPEAPWRVFVGAW